MGIIKRLICFVVLVVSSQATFAKAPSQMPDKIPTVSAGNTLVKFETTMGTFYAELYLKKDPATVGYFLKNVEYGYYKNILFHRIIDGFVLQGGKFDQNFNLKNNEQNRLKNQSKTSELKNLYGSIAIVHLKDDPDIATNEFFINLSRNNELDGSDNQFGYTVIGQVIQGMDTLRRISRIKTWEKDGNLYAPFFSDEALIKEISRVQTDS